MTTARRFLPVVFLVVLTTACTTIEPAARLASSAAPAETNFDHSLFDGVLQRFVDADGGVDYTALLQDRADLDAYYAALAQASPDSHPLLFPDEDARLAYWINAYNATVLVAVLDHYPIESVKDVNPTALFFVPRLVGFFLLQRVILGGQKTNFYDLENEIIRERFADPRIHFALNCASASCPRLARRAFSAHDLQAQLQAEAVFFVSEQRNVDIDAQHHEITLSSIFDWYESDFVDFMKTEHPDADATLGGYLRLYLTPERAGSLDACRSCTVEFAAYDWSLNDQRQAD